MRSQRSGHRPPTGYYPAQSHEHDRTQWPAGEPYEQEADGLAGWQTPEITAYSPVTEEASVMDRMTLGARSRAGAMSSANQGSGVPL